ncbi:hypothetical protein [Actinomadura yumaensis]|uniref:hypothetical protein n=1 Tax=Actinomadura yumaensis TaxID=111807 RepID=UPI00366FA99D
MTALTPVASATAAAPLRVTVNGFDAGPEPVAYTGTVTGHGQFMVARADGSKAPAPYVPYRLQFSADKKNLGQQERADVDG